MKYLKRFVRCFTILVQLFVGAILLVAYNLVGEFDNEDWFVNLHIHK